MLCIGCDSDIIVFYLYSTPVSLALSGYHKPDLYHYTNGCKSKHLTCENFVKARNGTKD